MTSANDVFQIPVSPSITERCEMLKKKGASGLGSLADDILPHHYPLQSRRSSQDHEVEHEVRDTNLHHVLGAREKSGNSRSSVESVQRSGPPDTGAYKRFNGKEQKEREKRAENWISAVWKVTGRLQERLFRLLKKIPSCTNTLCTKRTAFSLEILDELLQEW